MQVLFRVRLAKTSGTLLLALRKDNLTPIGLRIDNYAEDDLFDVIEFLYEHCSRPIKEDGYHHTFSQRGWHFNSFERDPGRREYRERINELPALYESGYELSDDGELLLSPMMALAIFLTRNCQRSILRTSTVAWRRQTEVRRYRSSLMNVAMQSAILPMCWSISSHVHMLFLIAQMSPTSFIS